DGLYKPDKPITRAEFISLIVRALQAEFSGGHTFNDTTNHWAEAEIAAAAARGWVSGYADGSFRPNTPMTREEMAVIIVNAFELRAASEGHTFADDTTISGWAKRAVQAAAESGIIQGNQSGRF